MRTLLPLLAAALLAPACVVVGPAVLCADPAACGEHDYCDYPGGDACGHAGSRGLCLARPGACPEYAEPVCGCDGRTYANSCLARGGGTDVARSGACNDPCVAADVHAFGVCAAVLGWYWDGHACAALSGCTCTGVDCAGGFATQGACETAHASCTTHACTRTTACATTQWCDFADGSMCGAAPADGVCRDRPTACPPVIHPVCGCDGTTYPSACDANVAGTDVAYDGACTTGHVCGGFAGFRCAATEWCDFPDGAQCGAADQTGTCAPRPAVCTLIYAPVCGCDGTTYGNECQANGAGTDVAYAGPCDSGHACGAGAAPCGAMEWCDVPEGATCDAAGTCRARPGACPAYYSLVCGCDGTTYSNPCVAESAGVDVAYPGACASPPDCRSLGCAAGSHCDACLGPSGAVWSCLPDGAVC